MNLCLSLSREAFYQKSHDDCREIFVAILLSAGTPPTNTRAHLNDSAFSVHFLMFFSDSPPANLRYFKLFGVVTISNSLKKEQRCSLLLIANLLLHYDSIGILSSKSYTIQVQK